MAIIENIKRDLANERCEGFNLDANGNSLTVRRLNKWQFNVVSENNRGTENFYPKMEASEIIRWAADMVDDDCDYEYVAHIPTAALWDEEKISKFMAGLCAQMCKTSFSGFCLFADDGVDTYVVVRDPNLMDWYADGKATNFAGIVKRTKKKLSEPHAWKYSAF